MAAVVRIGESKKSYSFETLACGEKVAGKEFNYYDYFTESGIFLTYKFRKVVEEVMEGT